MPKQPQASLKQGIHPTPKVFHTQTLESLFEQLQTGPTGLSQSEAQQRCERLGPNQLPKGKPLQLWQVVLHQFSSPLIYILLLAAGLSALSHEYMDAAFIGVVLALNALIGSFQEWRAEQQAAGLNQMLQLEVQVRRDHSWKLLPAEQLVPGDVVLLEPGIRVPADLRLLKGRRLEVEEALLTGESLPVEKQPGTLDDPHLPLGDRSNLLYAGTTLLQGQGEALVVATGAQSEIGRIAQSVASNKGAKTPLLERMERFTQRISYGVLLAGLGVVGIGMLRGNGLTEMLLFAIAMAVSAIPEGLPVAMTVALSIGSSRMARRKVIVRRLAAVEGLGSCTLIATDKTGTLTVDQQTVKQIWLPDNRRYTVLGEGYNGEGAIVDTDNNPLEQLPEGLFQLIEAGVICNEAYLQQDQQGWHHHGDAVDISLLALSCKASHDPEHLRYRHERVLELPFDPLKKYAAVYSQTPQGLQVDVKGAPEALAAYLEPEVAAAMCAQAHSLSSDGHRVIALARAFPAQAGEALPPLQLLGLVGLIDPVKPEAPEAVRICHAAGIQVAMITGDHPATALAIARTLNIASQSEEVITGPELEQADDPVALIKGRKVFARVNPEQKLEIVRQLQAAGHFVAVTGDGVNDAPALKQAHIGVAMGYGTDVAKEAASLIVTNNQLGAIAAAVEEGRYTYANIRKIIFLLISSGIGEVGLVILTLALDLPLPFLPIQLLWMNLVTNGLQDVALAFEKGEPGVMRRSPRGAEEKIFDRAMLRQVVLSSGLIMGVSLLVWLVLLASDLPLAEARSQAVLLMVWFQNFHALNCRSESRSVFAIPFGNNRFLWLAVLGAQVLHLLMMYLPFGTQLLGFYPIDLQTWLLYFALGSSILWLMEGYKWLMQRRKVTDSQP